MQPIIMVGLGTGAAPFRAFMQHRAYLSTIGVRAGPLLYYFGSRHRSEEYLYGEEIEAFLADGILTHAGLAFSRDQTQKIYIQHKMREDAEMLVTLLDSDSRGVFYLCGPTWPVPDVFDSLVKALVRYRGKTADEAAQFIENLKEEERYVLEVSGNFISTLALMTQASYCRCTECRLSAHLQGYRRNLDIIIFG